MKRMILRKLTLSGYEKKDATLLFEEGLNVITGDSDTGKTYAFQCLNYILGAENPPKSISEAAGYSTISLDFSVDDDLYTLERTIGASKIEVTHDDEKNLIPCKHDATNAKNLSRYLLQLLQEHDQIAFLKKNQKNEKRSLSFRDIVHLITVGETDIIAESSAFQSIQYTEQTVRKSVLKYIITGVDDRHIVTVADSANENIRRTGVVKFLEKKKELLTEKILAIEDDKNYKLFTGTDSMQGMITKIKELRDEISKANEIITSNQFSIQDFEKVCFADEVKLNEFKKLKHHYQEELTKYHMISTYSDFLVQTPLLNCPVCRQEIVPEIIDTADTEKLFEYYKSYTLQLSQKIIGLSASIDDIETRITDSKVFLIKLNEDNLRLTESMIEAQNKLKRMNRNISAIRKLDAMKRSLEIYKQELVSVEFDIIAYSERLKEAKKPIDKQDPSLYTGYCLAIENVLKCWGFSDEVKVTFDVDTLDLFIDNKARSDWGKGYRAFVMSAMVIGLMRYCLENNKLHPGFVILDSPLVSLKERKKDPSGKWVSDYMEQKMIADILDHDCLHQVIIFENKDLKYNHEYNYTEFLHDGDGRKGFIDMTIE